MRKNILTTFLLFVFLVVMMQNVNAAVNISATNAIVVDAETNEIIYAKDIDSKIYPASITKLLTATILTQHKQKDDLLTYTQDASEEEPYTIIANVIPTLQVGDKFTADEVMKMLLIFSGNDMAVMIAENVAASIDDFMKEINDYAQSIGMKNSHFVTPNGLQNDDHYTTAYDLSLLMREVIKNPWIMEVLAMPTADIEFNGETYTIETRNHLLGIDGCVGGKTGQTDEAGKCLASYFEVGSRKLISVVLNDTLDNVDDETSAVFVDTLSVVQYALEQKKEPYIVKDSQVQEGTITYKPLKYFGPERTVNVGAILKDDFSIYKNDVNTAAVSTQYDINFNSLDAWNLNKDTPIGKLMITQREGTQTMNLYPSIDTQEIIDSNKKLYILVFSIAGLIVLIILILIILIIVKVSHGKKKAKNRRYR